MMTARELQPVIGRKVSVRYESISVDCVVLDAREVWGRRDVLVHPVSGEGQQWVSADRCIVVNGIVSVSIS